MRNQRSIEFSNRSIACAGLQFDTGQVTTLGDDLPAMSPAQLAWLNDPMVSAQMREKRKESMLMQTVCVPAPPPLTVANHPLKAISHARERVLSCRAQYLFAFLRNTVYNYEYWP